MNASVGLENIFTLFTRLITNIQRCIKKIKDKYMRTLGLKSGHVSCLYYLYKMGPLTLSQLGDICDENKAAISRKVEYLTANQYVERSSQDNNKYKLPIILTKKGEKIAKFIESKINEIILEANQDLSNKNRDILYSSLENINVRLQTIIKNKEK